MKSQYTCESRAQYSAHRHRSGRYQVITCSSPLGQESKQVTIHLDRTSIIKEHTRVGVEEEDAGGNQLPSTPDITTIHKYIISQNKIQIPLSSITHTYKES